MGKMFCRLGPTTEVKKNKNKTKKTKQEKRETVKTFETRVPMKIVWLIAPLITRSF